MRAPTRGPFPLAGNASRVTISPSAVGTSPRHDPAVRASVRSAGDRRARLPRVALPRVAPELPAPTLFATLFYKGGAAVE
jgi:hypothetical protein